MSKLLIVILAHNDQECLKDMVQNVQFFCPEADIALYNSGTEPGLGYNLPILKIEPNQVLEYARIAPFFFDTFEWLKERKFPYNFVTNLDSDVLFIKHGFEDFIEQYMQGYDYIAPDFRQNIHTRPRWRPIRSLRPELSRWYDFWGFNYAHGAFNPGQTFSRNYIRLLVNHRKYLQLLKLVSQNQSYTLHEVLFPTLVDFLAVNGRSYPDELNPIIRYRPYQAVSGVKRALATNHAYFVHPVRRDLDDPARKFISTLIRNETG